jgi:hypothetical protein
MELRNTTPFPALAFQGVDQHAQRFHVVALRQTLVWDEQGQLSYAPTQAPLCEADEYFSQVPGQGSVRQESDLCQYKPRCDVIINALAWPPQPNAIADNRFSVRALIRRADAPQELPPEPEGLNPTMSPSAEQLARWKAAIERAQSTAQAGDILMDKTLRITGQRQLQRQAAPVRMLSGAFKLGSLGLIDMDEWQLTEPAPLQSDAPLPITLENAFGGQCQISSEHPLAERIPTQERLSPEQAHNHPSHLANEAPPIAHHMLSANPAGMGFARDWYLQTQASQGIGQLAAPRIEWPDRPLTQEHIQQAAKSPNDPSLQRNLASLVAGLGVRPKTHPERVVLAGTIDQAFVESDDPLPQDFDFAVWNAAWPDQQTPLLQGDEMIALMNLCAANAPAARLDKSGNTVLKLMLPGHSVRLLVRLEFGEVFMHPMQIDTLIIEPQLQQIQLVWRTVLALDEEVPIRMAQAHCMNAEIAAQFDQETQLWQDLLAHNQASVDLQAMEAAHGH